MELFHSCSALSAVIATAFHSKGKLLSVSERCHKKRYQHWDKGFGFLNERACFHIRSSCFLCRHYLVCFLDKGRDKSQGNSHHCKLMDRHFYLFQRRKQSFDSVCQVDRRGGVGKKRSADNKADYPYHHEHCRVNAFIGYLEKFPLKIGFTRSDKKQIEYRREYYYRHDRFQAF